MFLKIKQAWDVKSVIYFLCVRKKSKALSFCLSFSSSYVAMKCFEFSFLDW